MNNKEAIEKLKEILFMTGYKEALDLAINALDERPQGEWINICTLPVIRKCSLCGVEQHGEASFYDNYCSYCGAYMRKGVRKNETGD